MELVDRLDLNHLVRSGIRVEVLARIWLKYHVLVDLLLGQEVVMRQQRVVILGQQGFGRARHVSAILRARGLARLLDQSLSVLP